AWTKGFRGFDVEQAYAAIRKNAVIPQVGDRDNHWPDRGNFGDFPETRAGLGRYMEIGYVAGDETAESVSRTQDFGLQDIAASIMADATGHHEDAEYFRKRSMNYRNLWNADSALFLPRASDGSWIAPDSGNHYTECSPLTALWCIPYDVEGLVQLMGGNDVMEERLDDYFDDVFFKPERGNRSIHGNEPSHHVAYLYNRIGRPEKTQLRVREILSECYSTDRKGFDGNEDCGQMSAWYIMSSLGLYMLNPADGWYELGAPCVRRAELKLQSGKTLEIVAKNLSDRTFKVHRVIFNGHVLDDWRISHDELMAGGELVFEY
ncbi:MAG: glycoside hydrolase family 92 protein, partial [Bacteroidales bacterium]|nr:glycoside hydrolase family 92 protein [Bacteroidales bacterium]